MVSLLRLAAALAAALVLGGLVVTTPVSATVSAAQITAPANPSFSIVALDAASQTFAVSGTTTGGGRQGRPALLLRRDPPSSSKGNVALNSDGSCSVPPADLTKLRRRVVPSLVGQTLAAAKAMRRKAFCSARQRSTLREQGLAAAGQTGSGRSRESVAMHAERCDDAGMPTCRACGQDNPEVARFCLACGAPLAEETALREERRIVSVVFVDLVGFTSRSEQLDPEDVRAILTPYHATVRDELESFGGIVEKFVGDAVMAVFGAPTAHGDDPERAVRAALAVRDAVAVLNIEQPQLELRIRGAVNTGEAVVTLSARPALGEAMVAGDVVNTASRLQQHAPVGEIAVGEETYLATRSAIEYEPLEAVTAKGKAEPLAAWRAVAAASASGERHLSETPFVGRSREVGLLDATWEHVERERRPHLITVLGAPGVGKSRLAAEFTDRISSRGGRVVRGRCLPYRERSAYGAFTSQVKELAGIYDSDDVAVATGKLRTLVERLVGPEEAEAVAGHIAILLGFETKATTPDRDTLFQSVRLFIEAGARDEATAFVFEDIHWADPVLLDLIQLLAARLHDLPVLLLTLARPELLDTRPAWGGGLVAYNALPLEPLGGQEASELALHLLGADTKAIEVARAGEGNPLFIEQLAAVLNESRRAGGKPPHDDPRPRGSAARCAPGRGAGDPPRRFDRRPDLLEGRARAPRARSRLPRRPPRRARAA